MKELYAIKSPRGIIQYATIFDDSDVSWDIMLDILFDQRGESNTFEELEAEGFKMVTLRIEEIK